MLLLKDVSFIIRKRIILNRINLSLSKGLIGILGENGQGKSTLLQIMAGHLKPSQGQVLIQDLNLYKQSSLKHLLSYIPAQPFLYPHLTLIENFQWLLKMRALNEAKYLEMMSLFFKTEEIQQYQNTLFEKLSDGLKKRAMIVAGLSRNATIYILDEPCAALSPLWRNMTWQYLKKLAQTHLIILTSHQPDEINAYCDAIYLLEDQKLRLYEPSKDVLSC